MTNKTPLVSIIVPAYNAEKTIGKFINSILNQTYPNIELIIVNDGSNDRTKEIVKDFIEKSKEFNIKLVDQENQGMTRARNNGYKQSQGEYVWFLDSDMELPIGNEIEKCVKKCEKEGWDGLMIPERSQGSGLWAKCRGFEKILNDDDIYKNAVRFMRRYIPENIGLYDSELTAAEDFEFHNRAMSAGFKTTLIKDIFIYHYEVESVKKMIKKAYNYGKTMPLYIKKYPKESFQQFFILRPSYLKNWKKFLKNPLLGLGLLFMKFIQYIAASIGMMVYWVRKIIGNK